MLLGNFPQAFTHLALVEAALTLDERLVATRRRARVAAAVALTPYPPPATRVPGPSKIERGVAAGPVMPVCFNEFRIKGW